MKPRHRELNVFSMSALDLFASGMGAFILLAVMALPFFPNTGDSKVRIEDVRTELAAARQQRDEAVRQRNAAERLRRQSERAARQGSASSVDAELAQQQRDEAERQRDRAEQSLSEAEERLAEARRALEEAWSKLERQAKRAENLGKELAKAQFPDLDLVICLDVSGSMQRQIDGLKREISNLAKVLDRLAPSAGVGVVAFGDRRWQNPIFVQDLVQTSNMSALQRFVDTLEPNMRDPLARSNRDYPEDLAKALSQATGLSWRPASKRRYIIVVTDAPAYPEEQGYALQTARAFAAVEDQHVSAVMAWDGPGKPRPFLQQLAAAGQGQFVDASGGESMLASVLLAILGV